MREKKKFRMPHLLWITVGLTLLTSICTYTIPARQFGTNEVGQVMGNSFSYLGYQTSVSSWRATFPFLNGLTGSSLIIFTVMTMGVSVAVILEAGAADDFLDWTTCKLRDKGEGILIPILFCLMVYLDSSDGSDALIAVVPIGPLLTRKLKLDPIVAIGMTTYATLIRFDTGPAKQVTTQMPMDVPAYSAFGTRFLLMNLFMVIGLIFLLKYVKEVKEDLTKSLIYGAEWDSSRVVTVDEESSLTKETKLARRTVVIMTVLFGQYFIIVLFGDGRTRLYNFTVTVSLISAVVAGTIGRMSTDQLADAVTEGLANMAFVGFVIGLTKAVSLAMTEGNIIHTVVYALTGPFMGLPKSVSSIGMTVIITVINPFIPPAIPRVVIPVPITKPIAETLHLVPQLAIQAFQFGDGFANLISPTFGRTMGSCAMVNVPFDKWSRWVLPKVIFSMVLSFALMFVPTSTGWGIQTADSRKEQQINQDMNQLIMEKTREYESYAIQRRRHSRTCAEATAEEFKASKCLKEEAAKLGLPIQELKGTGFIATLDTGRPGKTLTIRSDIGVLPMDKDSENLKELKTCVLVNPGAYHACGHGTRIAIALGAVKVLCDIREQPNGKILLAFEEGEEQDTGWPIMLEALVTHKIDAIYGNHVMAFMDAGTFCADEGPRMVGTIGIKVMANGKNGRGPRPDLAVNPIMVVNQIVTQPNTMWSTRLDVTKVMTPSVCMFQAGHIPGIIPDPAFLDGSCRYFDIEESYKAVAIIEQVAEGVTAVNECTVTFGKKQGVITTPVMNTPELVQLSWKEIQEMTPKGSLVHDVKRLASEPFNCYCDLFLCMFNFTGVCSEEEGCGMEHHNGKFDIDEDTLQSGMAVTARFAMDFLAGGKGEAND